MADLSSDRSVYIQGNATGSAIFSGDHNKVYVVYSTSVHPTLPLSSKASSRVGINPYKGLAAFKESDTDIYFGREAQIERLWKRFQDLFSQKTVPRVLPVVGPSGCGKSSLVRAGLIPELAKRPPPGKEQMRVAILVPGTHPIEALAAVLARVATNDPVPAEKVNEFERVLRKNGNDGKFDGLRRISTILPDIENLPLVILIDQFEEVYSLCKDKDARHIFIETILNAAVNPTENVTIILTLRSDFLGEVQQNPALNDVIGSDRSAIIPLMKTVELRRAIVAPARLSGYELDESVVDLLVKDTYGREGALPLLQFVLTRVWEGLFTGQNLADLYWEIGGIGGALAGKADEIYNRLTGPQLDITRRIFTGLVHLGEGTRDTRRRTTLRSLVSHHKELQSFEFVIQQFSSANVRLITLSYEGDDELLEITHEALIENWFQLKIWLDGSRDVFRTHREIETEAKRWQSSKRKREYLLQGKRLSDVKLFYESYSNISPLSVLEKEFYKKSVARQRMYIAGVIGVLSSIALLIQIYSREISSKRYIAWLYNRNLQQPILELTKGCSSRKILPAVSMRTFNMLFGTCNPLHKVYLTKLDLSGNNMSYVDFTASDLINVDLSDVRMDGSIFSGSKVISSKLDNASLRDADFSDSILSSSSFISADLRRSVLDNADLSNVDFRNAELHEVSAKGANFTGAKLVDADLREAIVTESQLRVAILCRTKFSEAIEIDPDRDCFFEDELDSN